MCLRVRNGAFDAIKSAAALALIPLPLRAAPRRRGFSIAVGSALGVRCQGHGTAYDFTGHRSKHESVEAVCLHTPRTGLNRVNCTNANTYRVGTSPLIPPYKSGLQRAALKPFGVSFSDIFLHAKKDVAAGGRSFRRASRDIEKHQYCAAGGRQSTTAPRKNEQKLNSKRPAAVPRAGLFPFSRSHHTTFSFHCLPLFFHFAEIFKKICFKTAPAPPKFRTAPT